MSELLQNGRFKSERKEMVELIRSRGVKDENLLKAMLKVPRHLFVNELFIGRAYEDSALPIGMSQTISQPYTVAVMTEALEVKKGSKILEIGTGSGYQAAILAEMGAKVYTIERYVELLNSARKNLEKLGYQVVSKCGDGTIGWSEFAPYDGIIVTAAAPDVPQPLLDQLADGGILVIPIGDIDTQNLHVIKKFKDKFDTRVIFGFRFVPLIGKMGWQGNG
ncbi:MAG: Protein-L-isoaspartate O-methyltransferase [Ignavibacteriae bacterium]|nr:MAG: Protein-L-isoaspartate O-methyltransferase [Ignavibacteriota bacterium]